MEKEEIKKEIAMSYEELCAYLLGKYGAAVCDYFANESCRSKSSKIRRTREGLLCHHMDEDKGGNLSNAISARSQPFAWQKKDRLVYCNLLEHLILHIKIAVLRQKKKLENPRDVMGFFTTGGIIAVCQDINDLFCSNKLRAQNRQAIFEIISNNYADYITIVKALLSYISNEYIGIRTHEKKYVVGGYFHFADGDYKIASISEKKEFCVFDSPGGPAKVRVGFLMSQFTYEDYVDYVATVLSNGYEVFYKSVYDAIIVDASSEQTLALSEYVDKFKVDFHGYGYAQYAGIKLPSGFGSINADQYISKGLLMYSDGDFDLDGMQPVFWEGSLIPPETKDHFFVIRFKSIFNIKNGEVPFIRYRESDYMRNESINLSETRNFRTHFVVLKTSDYFDSKTQQYYRHYRERGEVKEAVVVLTLGKDDFYLFKERYDIEKLEILDGCYFV